MHVIGRSGLPIVSMVRPWLSRWCPIDGIAMGRDGTPPYRGSSRPIASDGTGQVVPLICPVVPLGCPVGGLPTIHGGSSPGLSVASGRLCFFDDPVPFKTLGNLRDRLPADVRLIANLSF
jgi:hypothetical protein